MRNGHAATIHLLSISIDGAMSAFSSRAAWPLRFVGKRGTPLRDDTSSFF